MSDYSSFGSSFDSLSPSPGVGGGGQQNTAAMMQAVKQQIAVANAQELLTVSVEKYDKIYCTLLKLFFFMDIVSINF